MKKILYFLGILAGIAVIGLIVLSFTIDGIVKSNIEEIGTEMLNTAVEVDDVSTSIFDGTGTIDGISIQNPEGFSDSAAIKLKRIHLKMDISSMLSDTVVIDSLIINEPVVFSEQEGTTVNLKKLSEGIELSGSSEGGMIIDYLLVKDGRVTLNTDIRGEQTRQVELEQFEVTGIGRSGSNTIEQAVQQILESIIEQAIQKALKEGLKEQAKDKLKEIIDF